MKNYLSVAGIVINTIGTVFTLWTILSTKTSCVGTAEQFDKQAYNFSKEKRRVIVGLVGIILGNILQVIGVFL